MWIVPEKLTRHTLVARLQTQDRHTEPGTTSIRPSGHRDSARRDGVRGQRTAGYTASLPGASLFLLAVAHGRTARVPCAGRTARQMRDRRAVHGRPAPAIPDSAPPGVSSHTGTGSRISDRRVRGAARLRGANGGGKLNSAQIARLGQRYIPESAVPVNAIQEWSGSSSHRFDDSVIG